MNNEGDICQMSLTSYWTKVAEGMYAIFPLIFVFIKYSFCRNVTVYFATWLFALLTVLSCENCQVDKNKLSRHILISFCCLFFVLYCKCHNKLCVLLVKIWKALRKGSHVHLPTLTIQILKKEAGLSMNIWNLNINKCARK